MLKPQKVYHMGIPVNDIDRAQAFYTQVLGLEFKDRVGGKLKIDRLKCGPDDVVLFQRPQPLQRDSITEDGVTHQAFEMNLSLYDEALRTVKEKGLFLNIEDRESGKTIYLLDTEGNHLELHFATPHRG